MILCIYSSLFDIVNCNIIYFFICLTFVLFVFVLFCFYNLFYIIVLYRLLDSFVKNRKRSLNVYNLVILLV